MSPTFNFCYQPTKQHNLNCNTFISWLFDEYINHKTLVFVFALEFKENYDSNFRKFDQILFLFLNRLNYDNFNIKIAMKADNSIEILIDV